MSLTNRLRTIRRTADREAYVRQLERRVAELEAKERVLDGLTEAELDERLRVAGEKLADIERAEAEASA
jgi:hypothetical protein